MKCYNVSTEDFNEIVFAETPGKAKVFALDLGDALAGEYFIDLKARRLPFCDHLDTGEMKQVDWCSNAKLFCEAGWVYYSMDGCGETFCPFQVEERLLRSEEWAME